MPLLRDNREFALETTVASDPRSGTITGNLRIKGALRVSGILTIDKDGLRLMAADTDQNSYRIVSDTETLTRMYARLNGTVSESYLRATGKDASYPEGYLQLEAKTYDGSAHASTGAITLELMTEFGILKLSNAFGMVINQGSRDENIFEFDSTDVGHGVTGVAHTTSFGFIRKQQNDDGGLQLGGITEQVRGLQLRGISNATDNTLSTAGIANIVMDAQLRSGTGVTTIGAGQNILAIRDNGSTQAIVDSNGDLHLNAVANDNVWDEWDDIELVKAYRAATRPNYKQALQGRLLEHKQVLAETGVLSLDEEGRPFVSFKGWAGLMMDALCQLAAEVRRHDS